MPTNIRTHRRNVNHPGEPHELTFSCYRGYNFLTSDRVRIWLKQAMESAQAELEFELWAYVLMPEHIHLIVRPHRTMNDIGRIRRAIKEPVGRAAMKYIRAHRPDWLPKLTRRRGKRQERLFWQSGGGYDRNITEPTTLMTMIEYIHLNPVRRGLVEEAIDWEWSSAAQLTDNGTSPIHLDLIPPDWLDVGV